MKTKIYILVLLFSLSSIAQNYYTIDGREYFKEKGKWFIKDLTTDEKYLLNELSISIKLKDHIPRSALIALNNAHNISIERENHLGIIDLKLPEGSIFYSIIGAYLVSGLFEFVEMNSYGKFESIETTPNDPLFFNQHHLYNYSTWPHINIPLAWDLENGSTSPIIVAVLDEGVWMNHQDLNYASSHYDFVDDDYDPTPFLNDDHGTGVSGVFAAKTNNNLLISSVSGGWGYNFGSKVMAIRVGTGSENQQTWSSRVDDGILFAADNGAKVINMSFRCSETNAIKIAIDYAYNSKGCLLVAAAGNKTSELYPYFPANYDKVIAVGGISKTWLNWGNKGIELVAPAQQIISTSNGDFATANFDATSFSAPQVSGVAALLFSRKPNLLPKDVRNVLNLAAVYEPQMENDPAKFGSGLLKADRSIQGILLGAGFIPDYPTNLSCEAIPNTNPVLKWPTVAPTLILIPTLSHYNIYRSIAPSKYNFSKVGEVQHNTNLKYHSWIDNSVTVPSVVNHIIFIE